MLTVMTWNVENLFRPEPGAEDPYAEKLEGLAGMIREFDPDVVALQEVGSRDALDDLVAAIGGRWHVRLSRSPDKRGIRVGVIARRELTDAQDVVDLPPKLAPLQADDSGAVTTRAGRGVLAVSVRGETGATVRLVTAHLKSKLVTYPGGRFAPRDEDERARYAAYALYRRAAEATMARTFCNAELDGEGERRALVLLGDMNDEPDAATSQILVGPGGSEIGTPGAERPDRGDAYRLFNLASLLPEGERQTRVYRGRGEIIDHILVSRALLERIEPGSVRAPVARTLPSIVDDPGRRPADDASDHSPVLVTLDI